MYLLRRSKSEKIASTTLAQVVPYHRIRRSLKKIAYNIFYDFLIFRREIFNNTTYDGVKNILEIYVWIFNNIYSVFDNKMVWRFTSHTSFWELLLESLDRFLRYR